MAAHLLSAATLLAATGALASMEEDPLLVRVMLDELEWRGSGGPDTWAFDGGMWIGRDIDKFVLEAELERVRGLTEEAEMRLLWSRAVSSFWDLRVGWRRDLEPEPERDWLAFGLHGLAPWWIEVDGVLFAGEGGRLAARIGLEVEILVSQRLALIPELELDLNAEDDPGTGVGSGLSTLTGGLRLRYELRREFAPYIGVHWMRRYGDTAGFARAEGEDVDDLHFVAGVRAWW